MIYVRHIIIFLVEKKNNVISCYISLDSAMFLLTGNPRSSLNSLRSEVRTSDLLTSLNGGMNVGNGSSSTFTKIAETQVKPGEVNAQDSLKNLLDCCILYYYAVAHKYIIMVSYSL